MTRTHVISGFLLLSLNGAMAAPAVNSCGSVLRSTVTLAQDARLWQVGANLLYEYASGVSLSGSRTSAQFPFQNGTGEHLLGIFTGASANTYYFVTQQTRGFAIYRWDQANLLSPVLANVFSGKVSFIASASRTILSPVVDAYADGSNFYLLANFHMIVLSRSDVDNGVYRPSFEPIPGCTSFDQACWRGAGFFVQNNALYITQMNHSLPGSVQVQYSRSLTGSSGTWSQLGSPLSFSGAYVNVLRSANTFDSKDQNVLVAMNGSAPVFFWGNKNGPLSLEARDYPTAISLIGSRSDFTGAVSYKNNGVRVYKNGTLLCAAFGSVRSLVVSDQNHVMTVTGIDLAGYQETVTIND